MAFIDSIKALNLVDAKRCFPKDWMETQERQENAS
jgi:hypothetical protein